MKSIEENDRFRLLVENIPDYAIFMLDVRGSIVSWNLGAERLKRYKAKEVIGRSFTIFYPPSEIAAKKPQRDLRMARAKGRFEDEGWRIRKDGTRFWANVVLTPIRDARGAHVGFAKVTRDMTDQRAAAEALAASERRQRLMIQNVKDYAIFMLDTDGMVSSWNAGAEKIKGYRASEIIGRHFSTFYPPEDIKAGKPDMELRVAVAEGRFEDEGWRLRKDGTPFWANVVISPMWSENGKELLGFAKVTRDLTERRRAEEAIRRSNQELEQYAGFVSHDLQEPLRKMASFSELLARQYSGTLDPEGERYIRSIVDGARRMRALITDVLEFARLSHASSPAPAALALNKVISAVRGDLELAFKEARGKISVGRLPKVNGEAAPLGRLFQNLLSNAAKFRDARRPLRVDVSARRRGAEWVVRVRDNGIGFDAAKAEAIFEPFKRLHRKDQYPGSGLGLAVCRKIASAWGGRVWAESRPGRGSSFLVSFPAMK